MADARNIAAYSTLASGITAAASSLSVASGEGARFPASGSWVLNVYDSRYPNFAVAYQNGAGEAMQITSRSTDTLTIGTRAYLDPQSKGAKAFNTSGVTYRIEMNQIDASETASGDVNTATQSFGGFKTFTAHAGSGKDSTTTGKYRFYTAGGAEYGEATTTNPLASNRTWTFPDDTGTVALTKNTGSVYMTPMSASTTGPSLVRYVNFMTGGSQSSSEANVEYLLSPITGTIKYLTAYINGNAAITSYVCTLRVAGVDTSVVVNAQIGTSIRDTTNTAAVTFGQTISIKVAAGANGGFSPSLQGFSFVIERTS